VKKKSETEREKKRYICIILIVNNARFKQDASDVLNKNLRLQTCFFFIAVNNCYITTIRFPNFFYLINFLKKHKLVSPNKPW